MELKFIQIVGQQFIKFKIKGVKEMVEIELEIIQMFSYQNRILKEL